MSKAVEAINQHRLKARAKSSPPTPVPPSTVLTTSADSDDEGPIVSAALEEEMVKEDQLQLDQDEDVLDTWFSAGLFPFSVFGGCFS